MKTNDVLQLGPYRYKVLKRDGNRALIAFTESQTGIYKEIWLLIKKTSVEFSKAG